MSFPWDKDTFRAKIEKGLSIQDVQMVSSSINSKKITFLDLVQCLESVLNDKQNEIRLGGTSLLSNLLTSLSIELSALELEAIATFYKDRLHDHHSFYPALIKGILSLVQQTNIKDETIARVMKELFQTISCQSQTREDRENYFQIIQNVGCERTSGKLSNN